MRVLPSPESTATLLTGQNTNAASPSVSVPVVHLHFNAPARQGKRDRKSHFKKGQLESRGHEKGKDVRDQPAPDGKQLLRRLTRLQRGALSAAGMVITPQTFATAYYNSDILFGIIPSRMQTRR